MDQQHPPEPKPKSKAPEPATQGETILPPTDALLRDIRRLRQLAEDFEFNLRGVNGLNTRDLARHSAKLTQQTRIIHAALLLAKDQQNPDEKLF